MNAPIARMGDAALVVTFVGEPLDEANDRAIALAASLRADAIAGVLDIVPAMASVAVHFDPDAAGALDIEAVLRDRLALASQPGKLNREEGAVHEIPVVYGGDAGPDLADVASFGGCSEAEVIERHASRVYRVYMLGFLPGFAYLGPVDASIAAPRRPSPRQRVPAGSVGIAGAQTGVYPQESPGGWQIIGRTDLRMFDAATGARLQPGGRVRFVPRSAR